MCAPAGVRAGYIGVVNRSQEEIDKNVPVQELRAREASFFQEKYP